MRRWMPLATTLAFAVALGACEGMGDSQTAPDMEMDLPTAFAQTGNGMQSGAHYNLNIIGVKYDKTADMDDNNGHRIFVRLNYSTGRGPGKNESDMKWEDVDKTNTILLCQSGVGKECDHVETDAFAVIDANATDKGGAMFALPAGGYTIYARALGKPGGDATMRTCGWENLDQLADDDLLNDEYGDVWCSLDALNAVRETGKPKAMDVTTVLTTLHLNLTEAMDAGLYECFGGVLGSGVPVNDSVQIFDPCFEYYFWNYDNNGLKLLQLRFYPVEV